MKSILVRSPNWIGDQILAYPFFHYLRKAYSKAHIAAVCVGWVEDVQFRDLVDEIIVLPPPRAPGWRERLRALEAGARDLRGRRGWDLAIALPNSLSSAWLLYRSGAELRRGYKAEGRGLLLNQGLPWDPTPSRHRAQAYVDLLPDKAKPLRRIKEFWGIPPANELDPGIPGELSRFDAAKSWPHVKPVEPPSGPYWVLAPGATADSRRWPEEYFISLARLITEQTGFQGLVIGGPKEAPIASRICEDRTLKLKDYVAQGPVSSLWRILGGARFTVTNESGLAHVAALCGSPVQIICGAANPQRTEPLGPGRVRVMINPLDCWPCERNSCSQQGAKYLQCMKGIAPDAVWEEIKRGFKPC